MTQMTDTEGAEIPKNENGRPYFEIHLYNMNSEDGPEISINVPEFFEGEDGSQYDSHGVLTVPIREVLDDYIEEFWDADRGEGLPKFVEWLRDYANRLESAYVQVTAQHAPAPLDTALPATQPNR